MSVDDAPRHLDDEDVQAVDATTGTDVDITHGCDCDMMFYVAELPVEFR